MTATYINIVSPPPAPRSGIPICLIRHYADAIAYLHGIKLRHGFKADQHDDWQYEMLGSEKPECMMKCWAGDANGPRDGEWHLSWIENLDYEGSEVEELDMKVESNEEEDHSKTDSKGKEILRR